MREPAERAWFGLCLALGQVLRASRYSSVEFVGIRGAYVVRKKRAAYAPLLVWLGGPLMRLLNTGVRVLNQREWEERELRLFQELYAEKICVDSSGVLQLPHLPGETLATILENAKLPFCDRMRAITLAVVALAAFHARGFTHGDAMAENVLVDLGAGVARWFDFETVHEPHHPVDWCRADDLRALIATVCARVPREQLHDVVQRISDRYPHREAWNLLPTSFSVSFRRELIYHLGQARLSRQQCRCVSRNIVMLADSQTDVSLR